MTPFDILQLIIDLKAYFKINSSGIKSNFQSFVFHVQISKVVSQYSHISLLQIAQIVIRYKEKLLNILIKINVWLTYVLAGYEWKTKAILNPDYEQFLTVILAKMAFKTC